MSKQEYITKIAALVQKHASAYGIKCPSAVIAQAILESGYGESILAAKYHNYFGLKCGTVWKGRSVNMATKEEYSAGTQTSIRANFRVYNSMEDGVKGYFEFIQAPRYKNLKGITDPQTYLQKIKDDGYATSSTYVTNCMRLVNEWNLVQYDKGKTEKTEKNEKKKARTAQDYLKVFRSWVGFSETNGKFKQIIDIYNSHTPLALGYKVKYTDEWCDTTVSAAAIQAGMVDLIGTECGCERHIAIFKKLGIWIEDGTVTPKPGYIIVYNWNTRTQPNEGFADHIGVVDSVKNGIITCIEGNKGEAVGYRSIPVGWGYIRGYAAPKYDGEEETVQAEVPEASAPAPEKKSVGISKDPSWEGRVTASVLNVRTWAGIRYPRIKTFPTITRGTKVEVCDNVKASDGSTWYYIRIAGRIYGFVHSGYIVKA